MVDFRKLKGTPKKELPTDPFEIFKRLPKPSHINDLYNSQAQVLRDWQERKNQRDLVIKLHTGGGKTLVGLLIAQSMLNEKKGPIIYLAPNNQLVEQCIDKANEFHLPIVRYESGEDLSSDFLDWKKILICNYHSLFNGQSKFGTRHGVKKIIQPYCIILDDAHVAFSTLRDQYSIKISRSDYVDSYFTLSNIFRESFHEIGKEGSFDDIINGQELHSILEVPYWSWKNNQSTVIHVLRTIQNEFPFTWPFLRDNLLFCHALISSEHFVITPIFPFVDLIPSFDECPHRVYMSATISDDSIILRTFGADFDSVKSPIRSNTLAGVSERMIIVPDLISMKKMDTIDFIKKVAVYVNKKLQKNTIVLVPSNYAAEYWKDIAIFPEDSLSVKVKIKELQSGINSDPVVLANRYDGIDLPGDSCRVLIIHGMPQGSNEYEVYRSNVFMGKAELNNLFAQRVEQGLGRGARGSGDYCVIIVIGKDLVSWISQTNNFKMLTSSTVAQLEIGLEVSKEIENDKDFVATISKCLNRDKDWVEYHAEKLADISTDGSINIVDLEYAKIEREVLKLIRENHFDKALSKIDLFIEKKEADPLVRGWFNQLGGRIADLKGDTELRDKYQVTAYALNKNLLKSKQKITYVPQKIFFKQAETIVENIYEYKLKRGFLSKFDEIVSYFNPSATANQFEQALCDFGKLLGFISERPEKTLGIGPDVLWILNEKVAFVIEVKSRKEPDNPLSKAEHGQLLNSVQWFNENYKNINCLPVVVHPNNIMSDRITTSQTYAFTLTNLSQLSNEIRSIFEIICNSYNKVEEDVAICEGLISSSNINHPKIVQKYFELFTNVKSKL